MNGKLRVLGVSLLALALLAGCKSNRLKDERNALYQQNQELQSELEAKRAALDAAENERAALANQVAQLQAQLAQKPQVISTARTGFEGIEGIEAEREAGGIAVRVPGDVLFPSGRAELRSTSQKTLDQIASVIKKQYAGNTIRIEGYTDTDPIRKSKWTDNLELSLQRAAAVHRYLQKKGIDPKQMYAAGFGQWHPRDTKQKSRRVEIFVVTGRG